MRRANVLRSDGSPLVGRCDVTESSWERLCGLLPRGRMEADEALWISPCTSVHTFFMRFTIDVAFLDSRGKVIALYPRMSPWRLSWIHPWAVGALEAPAGLFEKTGLRKGEVLQICPSL